MQNKITTITKEHDFVQVEKKLPLIKNNHRKLYEGRKIIKRNE
jgi:hypothetical protein